MLSKFFSTLCAVAAFVCVADAAPAYTVTTTDPGDATSGAVEIDDSALKFIAQIDSGSNGSGGPNSISNAITAYLGTLGYTETYLGGENYGNSARSGLVGTSVTLGDYQNYTPGLAGTWTFNQGSTGYVPTFLAIHAGNGTVNDLFQIVNPGLTGIWDTSEFFNGHGVQTTLSFLDLYGDVSTACTVGCGGEQGNVSEPASFALLSAGLIGLGAVRRRQWR